MNKKSLTQTKLEELNLEKVEVEKQLQFWTEKSKKAEEYSEVLFETRRFTMDFWDYRINEARNTVKKDGAKEFWWLESETRDKTQFGIYYDALDLFKTEIKKKLKNKARTLELRLESIKNEIKKLQNRLNRKKPQEITNPAHE